jgi:hypothetical protein
MYGFSEKFRAIFIADCGFRIADCAEPQALGAIQRRKSAVWQRQFILQIFFILFM